MTGETPNGRLFEYADGEQLAEALAAEITKRLARALERRATASLVVPGGRTPIRLFAALRDRPLDWSRVWITLTDERRVPPEHEHSNERLVREHLLSGCAGAATLTGLSGGAADRAAEEANCQQRLASLPRPFDAVILGMGEDGHVASLFPGAPEIETALAANDGGPCQVMSAPDDPAGRITQRLTSLLDSRWIALCFTGAGKRAVFARALDDGPARDLPVRAVLHNGSTPVQAYWSP